MLQAKKKTLLLSALASSFIVLSACGGGGSSDAPDGSSTTDLSLDMTGDESTTASDGNNPTQTNQTNDSTIEIVSLDSLGPLKDRLYTGATNRMVVTGPVVGPGLIDYSELMYDLPFEVEQSEPDEVVIEKAYIVTRYAQTTEGELDFERASAAVYVVMTNVSNRLLCGVGTRLSKIELSNGEISEPIIDFLGYTAVKDESDNSDSEPFAFDCIPPGRSVVGRGAIGDIVAYAFIDAAATGDASVAGKLIVENLLASIEDTYTLVSDGLNPIAYEQSSTFEDEYLVRMINMTSRNLRIFTGSAYFIDPSTGLPIATTSIGDVVNSEFVDVVAPGEEVSGFGFNLFPGFTNGSTNSIITIPTYVDGDGT